MDELEEVRYPWDNLAQFMGGGYFTEWGALHLVLGGLFALWLTVRVLRAKQFSIPFRLASLYFALTVFTNPAYEIAGLKVNEIAGVLAVLSLVATRRAPKLSDASPITAGLFAVFLVGALHVLLTMAIYPELVSEPSELIQKFAVNLKILVLLANLLIVGHTLRRGTGIEWLVKVCVAAGTAALLLYIVQIGIFASGTLPYGTFLDAGYIGVPSFGSVSVERGHFGKFMAGYYVFFLFAMLGWGWKWRFALLVLVTLINFSASSQVFFAAFSLMALWKLRMRIKGVAATVVLVLAFGAVVGLMVWQWDVFAAMGDKIYKFAIQGDESQGAGRSFSTFDQYIARYPFGMGYSGSSLRTAPGLPEINAAHFVFIAQYSLLALPILVGYLLLVWRTLARVNSSVFMKAMSIGVMLSVLVFATDVLWFVPMLWLPFEMVWALTRHFATVRPVQPLQAGQRGLAEA